MAKQYAMNEFAPLTNFNFFPFFWKDLYLISSLIDNSLIILIGGKIENGSCKSPNSTALIGYECKPCIGGTIMLNRCRCPPEMILLMLLRINMKF